MPGGNINKKPIKEENSCPSESQWPEPGSLFPNLLAGAWGQFSRLNYSSVKMHRGQALDRCLSRSRHAPKDIWTPLWEEGGTSCFSTSSGFLFVVFRFLMLPSISSSLIERVLSEGPGNSKAIVANHYCETCSEESYHKTLMVCNLH